jgi:hypothetical protein
MLHFTADPRLEPSEPFTKRSFRHFREKLPKASFGTHAGLTVFLGYLLEQSARHAGAERWFRCCEDTVETELGLVPTTQKRLLELLLEIGYIEVQHLKKPAPARYLRANLDAIEQDMLADVAAVESK